MPDFRARVRQRHPGRWAVITALAMEILVIEDVLWKAEYPLSLRDLPDGSVGRLWSIHRRGQAWALDVANDVPIETGHCAPSGDEILAYPRLYRPAEMEHFDRWFRDVYAPERLPSYLVEKMRRDEHIWAAEGRQAPSVGAVVKAADLACRRLTGSPSRPPQRLARLTERTLFE
jgi:hypothetical protein